MIKRIFFLLKTYLLYYFIYAIDFFVWIIIIFIPNKLVYKLANYKFKSLPFIPNNINKISLKNNISNCLIFKQKKVFKFTSCLSITLTGKLLCDLVSIRTEINIGMLLYSDNQKIPHSWLYDPIEKIDLSLRMVDNSISIVDLHKF